MSLFGVHFHAMIPIYYIKPIRHHTYIVSDIIIEYVPASNVPYSIAAFDLLTLVLPVIYRGNCKSVFAVTS